MADIRKNLVFLAENIVNSSEVLLYLFQENIISEVEMEAVVCRKKPFERNVALLTLMERKSWDTNRKLFLDILRKTENEHCADIIEDAIVFGTRESMAQKITEDKKHYVISLTALILAVVILTLTDISTLHKYRNGIFFFATGVIFAFSVAMLYQYMNNPVSITKDISNNFFDTVPIIQDKTISNIRDSSASIIQDNIEHQQMWFEMTAPSMFYVGREEEMKLLRTYWNECMIKKNFSVVAVTGLGGVGKSELAKNFAKVFYEIIKGNCIWITAESNQLVEESFHNLARNLKISLKDDLGKEKKFLEVVEEVYQKLFGLKVLLVFDNLQNYELPALQFLTALSSRKPPTVLKPFVITTSRLLAAKIYFGSQYNHLDLQVLTQQAAMQFFCKSLGINETSGNSINGLIGRLCDRLQFFPLAMQQASAYINERLLFCGNVDEAIINYLTQIEKRTKALLDYNVPQYEALESISKTTFLTWRINIDQLRESKDCGELATDILNIISFLSSDNIPTQMVIDILRKMGKVSDIENIDNVFELIRKYSIINFSREKSISVHRLVQEVTRIELEERGEFYNILNGVADCLYDMFTKEEIYLKELIHVQIVWQYLSKDKEMTRKHAGLLKRICKKILNSGKYRYLLDFSTESEILLESALGSINEWTLKMKVWKGRALIELGEYLESLEILKDAYEKQKKCFGEEHRDCLKTSIEIGFAYFRLNKYEKALEIYKDALDKAELILGKEHRATLALRNGIALVLEAQNKLKEALKIYEEVLEVDERLLGVEHPSTLTTKHNIASALKTQNKLNEALKLYEEVLEVRELVLGAEHPDTLTTKNNFANVLKEQNKLNEALKLYEKVLEVRERVLGVEHPSTLTTKHNIASVLSEQTKLNEALKLYEEVLEVRERVLGVEHPSTLTTKHNIASVLSEQTKLNEALKLYEEVLEVRERVLGVEHPSTLTTKHNIASVLSEQTKLNEALKLYEEVLEVRERVLGAEHPDTLTTKNNIATVKFGQKTTKRP